MSQYFLNVTNTVFPTFQTGICETQIFKSKRYYFWTSFYLIITKLEYFKYCIAYVLSLQIVIVMFTKGQ
jgi:hypothetical protein